VTSRFDENRLTVLRHVNAALRAFGKEDFDTCNLILSPYKGNLEKGKTLTHELIEVVSGYARQASNVGLPTEDVLEHVLNQVPTDKEPEFQRARDVVLAVNEGKDKKTQDELLKFDSLDHFNKFVRAIGSCICMRSSFTMPLLTNLLKSEGLLPPPHWETSSHELVLRSHAWSSD
jgi:hypothetical protein